jgi:hypothetical protein
MTKLLVQNSKIKKSGNNEIVVYNFGIPALKSKDGLSTCPMAGKCAVGCYAKSGAYLFSNVAQAYENRLVAAQSDNFGAMIQTELNSAKKRAKTKKVYIRIHDSGDFFSPEYFKKWLVVMLNNPTVTFYAYTKMISFFKGIKLPSNFTLIYSLGGRQDSLIDQANDRHSRVFETIEELTAAGYVDTSKDDLKALGSNPKIGLVYHGNKNFEKTSWGSVEIDQDIKQVA